MAFHLKCPCKRSHAVTHLGFLLLEKVESTLGSAEQEVDKVFISNLVEPWFSALQARAVRQQRKVCRVKEIKFICKEGDQREKEIEKLLSLQQNCQKLTFTELWLICVDEEEAPSPRRLREGVQNIFFLK